MVGLLVGEQLSPNNDENRNIPRAPSLSIKDYSPSEPEESDDSSNVASISSLAASRVRTAKSKPFKLRPLTNDDMEVLNQPNAEQARLIVGSTPPSSDTEEEKPRSPDPTPLPVAATPQASPPTAQLEDRPPAPVIPLNQPGSEPQELSSPPASALPSHGKMVTLRKDVLALLTIASILFGIALGLGIAKLIGFPTLP